MAENNIEQKKEKLKGVHEKSLKMAGKTRPEDVKPLCPSKDAVKKMKYYSENMNTKIKKTFSQKIDPKHQGLLELSNELPKGSGTTFGTKWHSALQAYLSNSKNSDDYKTIPLKNTKDVVDKIKKKFVGFEFIRGELCLSGYMENKISQLVSFWHGKANAIGTCGGRYVIVHWKVVDVLNFWEKDRNAYGLYLHQCLVYARLLQLHLELDELPYIMIVAIDNTGSAKIHPRMFTDYPDECKDKFKEYNWSIKRPMSDVVPKNLINTDYKGGVGEVSGDVKISVFFNKNVTVDDLQKLFGSHKFMVEKDEEDEEDEDEEAKKVEAKKVEAKKVNKEK